jgi:Predicted pPIWI-associating nuclease
MPNDALLQRLRQRLPDQFSQDALNGALQVLRQTDNKMRAHQFAGTLRELTGHVLGVMAPTAEVSRRSWFKQEEGVEGPTRRQRALCTCRGGLTDAFLRDTLKLNPSDLHSQFSKSFEELNKRTHVRPDTVLTDADEVEEFADNAIAALLEVFETMDEVHETIVEAIANQLHGKATSAFINETIQELDEIAGRYETGMVSVEEAKVLSVDASTIRYQIKGSVDVTLHYGGGSDPTDIGESFPYECTAAAPVSDPTKFDSSETKMVVDTSSWRE